MQNGWSTKRLIRRLMLTSTYQQSANAGPAPHSADPENRYLWRMNRKRMDAESLRDGILAANGSLDLALGGESLNGGMQPRGMRTNGSDLLQSRRRSIYLPVFPGSLNELFQVFDFPDPHGLAGKRYVTTAPTQALFLMNSEFILAESAAWSSKLLEETGKNDAERVAEVYMKAYARPPSAVEKDHALDFIRKFSGAMAMVEPDPAARQKKAWQSFCQAIYESTEFRFIE
jgi:hypothetical protein